MSRLLVSLSPCLRVLCRPDLLTMSTTQPHFLFVTGKLAEDALRLISERHKESDGTVVDHYTFSVAPEGDMKINDKPIDSLFQ